MKDMGFFSFLEPKLIDAWYGQKPHNKNRLKNNFFLLWSQNVFFCFIQNSKINSNSDSTKVLETSRSLLWAFSVHYFDVISNFSPYLSLVSAGWIFLAIKQKRSNFSKFGCISQRVKAKGCRHKNPKRRCCDPIVECITRIKRIQSALVGKKEASKRDYSDLEVLTLLSSHSSNSSWILNERKTHFGFHRRGKSFFKNFLFFHITHRSKIRGGHRSFHCY